MASNPTRTDRSKKPLMVAQLREAASPDHYLLTVIDPYLGQQTALCHHVEDIAGICSRLDFAAKARNLQFEVQSLSGGSMTVLEPVNDNSKPRVPA